MGIGSTSELVGLNYGSLEALESYAYDAYGNLRITPTGPLLTSFLYSGEMTDAVTGQQYLRARYYDPVTGRFNRLDPFAGNGDDHQSLCKYLYVHADPIQGVDPTGKYSLVGTVSASSIGSSFSGQEGIAGEVVLESLDRRTLAWEVIGYEVAFLALSPVASVIGKLGGDAFDRLKIFFQRADDLGGVYADALSNVLRFSSQFVGAGTLRNAAKAVHELAGHANRFKNQTIAIAEVVLPNGKKGIMASVNGSSQLSRKQLEKLDELGVFIVRGGKHAELNIIDNLPSGSRVERWGISSGDKQKNYPCTKCTPSVAEIGGVVE